jgi:MFS family permease
MHQTRIINPARWHVLAVVVAAQFVFVVDAFIVNVAIPSIRRDLGATSGEMQAVIAVYQIAYATMVISLFMQGQLGFSPLQGGLAVVPLAVAFTVASRSPVPGSAATESPRWPVWLRSWSIPRSRSSWRC